MARESESSELLLVVVENAAAKGRYLERILVVAKQDYITFPII